MLRQEQARRQKAEAMHEVLLGAARDVLEPLRISGAVTSYRGKKVLGRGVKEAQLLHLSDLQIGKETATYDIEVFERRMDELFDTTVDLLKLHRKSRPVDELFIAMNGDLVEGEEIFPAQAWETQLPVLRQAVIGAEILAADVARISSNYKRIRVCVTSGNHGRMSKTANSKSSWDLALGEIFKHMVSEIKNVSVEICQDWYHVTKVNGVLVMQTHGHTVRSGGDTPCTAIVKRISRWRDSITEGFDVLLMGHFHNYAELEWNGAKFFLNGSPESSNDYAQSYMGMASNPMQTVLFLHPEKKVTARYPIYLGSVK
jgi:predicted phosphodiesterase